MPPMRGDVVLVRFPFADLQTYKLRPALVVQSDLLDTGYDDRVIAMITSQIRRRGPSCVAVHRDSELGRSMGLVADSVVVLHRLATVEAEEIDQIIGTCPDMSSIDVALRVALGID